MTLRLWLRRSHTQCDWRTRFATRISGPIVISGVIGPRGDGYVAEAPGSAEEAAEFHLPQATVLKAEGADMLSALTMTSVAEAIGVGRAGRVVGLPVSISFTMETDGRLPNGEALREAIERVDADTPPAYFGVNCAHPSHFDSCIDDTGAWIARIRGIRANASARSHAELNVATELDIGDLPIWRIVIHACARCFRHSMCSVAAAPPTTGICTRFATLGF